MTPTGPVSDPVFLEKFRRAFKSPSLFGLWQIVALAIYLLLEEIIRTRLQPFLGFASGSLPTGSRPILRYAFYAAAVAFVLLVRWIHGRRMRRIESTDNPDFILNGLSRTSFLALILAEIPAILGLILFLLAGYNRDFYVLLFVSLVLDFMYFPRMKNWEDILQRRPAACPR
ncbi:MAG: hypothetical protein ACYDH3_07305 [Candidatus Aminicenantales bacterium]